jgi:hypothetical protein
MDFKKLLSSILSFFGGSFGLTGTNLTLANTDAQTQCNYMCVVSHADNTVINTIAFGGTTDTAFSSYAMVRGEVIYGPITAITLTSGRVRLYNNAYASFIGSQR